MGHYDKFLEEKNGNRIDDAITKLGDAVDGVIRPKYRIGNKVIIDGCHDLVGVITAVTWRNEDVINYEVSWVCGGKAESAIIEGWRLSGAT